MTCESCGTVLKPNARFCGKCGAEVADEAPLPTPMRIGGSEPTGSPGPAPLIARESFWTTRNITLVSIAAVVVAVLVAVILLVSSFARPAAPASGDDGSGVSSVDDGEPDDGDVTGAGDGPVAIQLPDAVSVDSSHYAVPQWRDGVWFISPSGNLTCGIGASSGTVDFWGCAILEKDWAGGDAIAWDGGNEPSLRQGAAAFPNGAALETLPYGTSLTYDSITCVSLEAHVICADTTTGHGFTISRNENDIF